MNELVPTTERGLTTRHEVGRTQYERSAETALAAVAARERAVIEAQFIFAERHPRLWADVRVRILDHCSRPRFAEVSRYAKPTGSKIVNGEWVKQFAKGFTIRFAETLAQEMGNVKPESSITFEDDLIRIVRIGVTDLQNNLPWFREVVFAKTVERKGKQRKDKTWEPPEGREVISQRINSYGDPTYTVLATEDELRAKINSEIAKTQRDFLIKLCPRDILEDCEDRVYEVIDAEDKRDPKAAIKKWLDSFNKQGILPSDLVAYVGKPVDGFNDSDLKELRELAQAIKEGATFQACLKAKIDIPLEGEDETPAQRDARLQRQRTEQEERVRKATEENARKESKPRARAKSVMESEFVGMTMAERHQAFEDLRARLGFERFEAIKFEHGDRLEFAAYSAMRAALDSSMGAAVVT